MESPRRLVKGLWALPLQLSLVCYFQRKSDFAALLLRCAVEHDRTIKAHQEKLKNWRQNIVGNPSNEHPSAQQVPQEFSTQRTENCFCFAMLWFLCVTPVRWEHSEMPRQNKYPLRICSDNHSTFLPVTTSLMSLLLLLYFYFLYSTHSGILLSPNSLSLPFSTLTSFPLKCRGLACNHSSTSITSCILGTAAQFPQGYWTTWVTHTAVIRLCFFLFLCTTANHFVHSVHCWSEWQCTTLNATH